MTPIKGGFEVIDPGLLTTVQDQGRPGYAHLGVPRSGALDQGALALANRLVGNQADAAALEVTLTGCALRARGTQVAAVAGAFATITIGGRPDSWGARLVVPHDEILWVGPAQDGARAVIAVAGGVDVAPVLGSRSRDTLAGIGPAPLAVGDFLPTVVRVSDAVCADPVPFTATSRTVRLLRGPHADWCDPGKAATTWTVAAESNRVGLRLEGPSIPRRAGEIASFPMITGAVQLPPSGLPIVLLADHATTGGYPVIAVVDPADLDACGQLRPGDQLTLSWR